MMSLAVRVVDSARDPGVTIDRRLTMTDQVAAICTSAYIQLHPLRTITRSLSTDAVKAVVRAFIMCRLDCCNLLMYGITDDLLQRLQSKQECSLVSGTRRRDHSTPVLQQLYRLPVS